MRGIIAKRAEAAREGKAIDWHAGICMCMQVTEAACEFTFIQWIRLL